jgi:hypothetical protein
MFIISVVSSVEAHRVAEADYRLHATDPVPTEIEIAEGSVPATRHFVQCGLNFGQEDIDKTTGLWP